MRSLPSIISAALGAAVRAPSPHNIQPWLFEVDGSTVRLLLDRTRAGDEATQARLACGAALCNFRVALRAHDRVGFIDLLPDPANPDLLATVRVAGERVATATEHRLADAIGRMRVNRHNFLDRGVPEAGRSAMTSAAQTEGARLRFFDTAERYERVVQLIQAAEAVRDDGGTDRLEPIPPRLSERQPALVAVLSQAPGDRHDVLAGAGMQRALLTAAVLGLSATFLPRPLEVPSVRAQLASEVHSHGQLHMLLRVGYSQPVIASPRRPADEVSSQSQ